MRWWLVCLQLLDDGASKVGRLVVAAHVRRPVSAVRQSVRVSFPLPDELLFSGTGRNSQSREGKIPKKQSARRYIIEGEEMA